MGGGTQKKGILLHKNALNSALVRIKIRAGASTNEQLLPDQFRHVPPPIPRYARINTLLTSVEAACKHIVNDGYIIIGAPATTSVSTDAPAGAPLADDKKKYVIPPPYVCHDY